MPLSLTSEAARRRAVAWVLAVTADTYLAPKQYERHLLGQFERGELTLEAVNALLEGSVYHVFYWSQALYFPNEQQLQDLLAQSRTYNAHQGITGLLLYSEGRFAQVIEGTEAAVGALFDRIKQDPRHQHVFTLSEGPGPQRWFADWHMAFGQVEPLELTQALGAVKAGVAPLFPLADLRLQTLVEVFGLAQRNAD